MPSSDVRLRLHAAGFDPTAVRGKEALMVGWNKRYTAEEVAAWRNQYPAWSNTGIRCANAPAIDLDIKNPEAAEASEELIRNLYDGRGTLLTRIGEAPKRALLFRTTQPFPKIRVNFVAPNGSSHHIEILGDGQQIVVDGTHPTTQKPYCWQGGYQPGDIPWKDLPEINEAEARTLVALLSEMLVERFGFQEAEGNGLHPESSESHGPVDAEAELAAMAPTGEAVNHAQKRVIPSLLRRALSPQAVLETVVDATIAMAAKHGLAWTREREIRDVTSRVGSSLRMIQDDYDPASGVPSWLAEEFVDDWIRVLQDGGRPQLLRNRGGWYVRNTPRRSKSTDAGDTPTSDPPSSNKDPVSETPKKLRFKIVNFADLRPGPEPLYLVDELIPAGGLVDVWGKAKCFKSFWTLDLVLHVALGWEYRDRAVRQGAVVYCAFEGAHGYKKRMEALRRHYQTGTNVPLYLMPGQANLIKEHRILIADIRVQLNTVRPAAVVLDTLNKSLFGSENKDQDMGDYIRAAEAIRDAFGCVVIIVHHCGYDDTRPRGHSSLPGAVDAQLSVTRDENVITVTVEMMRDGPEETVVISEVKAIEVGEDQNGKPLTSLVVIPADTPAAVASKQAALPTSQRVFYRAMREALKTDGEAFQPDVFTAPVQAVEQEAVRSRFYESYATDGETPQKQQDARQKAFRRALESAQKDTVKARVLEGGKCMLWFKPKEAAD